MADEPKIVTTAPISREMADLIIKALRQKRVQAGCPECGTQRELNSGFILHQLHSTPEGHPAYALMVSDARIMPSIQVICPFCGHMSQFAFRILTHNVTPPAPSPAPGPAGRPNLQLVPLDDEDA